ncbi:MAG: hypothetical protein ABDI20_01635 [Candidatus Bipolaricaulaceae bacterium]
MGNDNIVLVLLIFLGILCILAIVSAPPQPEPVVVIVPTRPSDQPQATPSGPVGQAKEITCLVIVPEFIYNQNVDSPAVETAIINELLASNFSVVDQKAVDRIRYRDETLLAAYGRSEAAMTALRALAHDYRAEVMVLGTAFVEGQFGAPGGLMSTRAWAEVRAIDTRTGRIFAAEQVSAGGTDLVLTIAAKKALQNAGVLIGRAVAQGLERRFGKQQGVQDRVELILIGIPFEAYVAFKQQLQLFPQVKQIIADHYTVDEAHVTIYYLQADLVDLINYIRHLNVANGRLEVLTYSLSRVVVKYQRL